MSIRTPEEILKNKGITPESKHHSYDYLYKSMLEVMDEYWTQSNSILNEEQNQYLDEYIKKKESTFTPQYHIPTNNCPEIRKIYDGEMSYLRKVHAEIEERKRKEENQKD